MSADHHLVAAATRHVINPPLGTRKSGFRLFGDPIHGIESDITATVLVLGVGEDYLALLALDLVELSGAEADEIRDIVAEAIDAPRSNVLLNISHNHSSPGFPTFMEMCDSDEDLALKRAYKASVVRALGAAAREACDRLQPARFGVGWGESRIGVYRREFRNGQDMLGEVPDYPIDTSVGVLRVDALDGSPIAIGFRYSCHPVTVGGRATVASSDFPGAARDLVERSLGGYSLFLQGCGANVNPAVGIGYELDCRDTKNRVGMQLGAEVVKVAAGIRTDRRQGDRVELPGIKGILFRPWDLVDDTGAVQLGAVERRVELNFSELPSLDQARAIHHRCFESLERLVAEGAEEWQIRVAKKQEDWSRVLIAAVEHGSPKCELRVHALRMDDFAVIGLNVEAFFETGLDIRAKSPFENTFVLGYTNGLVSYLPRGDDYPPGGWRVDAMYALPDLIPQAWRLPVILHPESAAVSVAAAVEALHQLR